MSDLEKNYDGTFGKSAGTISRPVVLAIDFIRAYTTEGSPFFAQGVVSAVSRAGEFYDLARQYDTKIIHTRVLYDDPRPDAEVFLKKVPALRNLVSGEPLAEFDTNVTPQTDDIVLVKQHASAFYGTNLHEILRQLKADSVIVTGCTTSGCIRATVVDAMQHGYIPIVVEDLVGDRHPDPHDANIFDMKAKYADVLSSSEIIEILTESRTNATA